jgi:hypothetical protein
MQSSLAVPLRPSHVQGRSSGAVVVAAVALAVGAVLIPGSTAEKLVFLGLAAWIGLRAVGLRRAVQRGVLKVDAAGVEITAVGAPAQTIPWDAIGRVGPYLAELPDHDATWAVAVERQPAVMEIELTRPLELDVADGAGARPISRILLAPVDPGAAAAALTRRPRLQEVATGPAAGPPQPRRAERLARAAVMLAWTAIPLGGAIAFRMFVAHH